MKRSARLRDACIAKRSKNEESIKMKNANYPIGYKAQQKNSSFFTLHSSLFIKFYVFLKRIGHCRGFGIQSPTDFAFVNDVIYERSPYYAYSQLQGNKTDRAMLRISNYAQPQHYVIAEGTPPQRIAHLKAGCRLATTGRTLYYNALPPHFADGDSIIITDICHQGRQLWQALTGKRHQEHLIMFDMYYFGIAFVNKKRYSEVHKVNFY